MNCGIFLLGIAQSLHHCEGTVQAEMHHLHFVALMSQVFEGFVMVHGSRKGGVKTPENGFR
jgi:hypothetical protein